MKRASHLLPHVARALALGSSMLCTATVTATEKTLPTHIAEIVDDATQPGQPVDARKVSRSDLDQLWTDMKREGGRDPLQPPDNDDWQTARLEGLRKMKEVYVISNDKNAPLALVGLGKDGRVHKLHVSDANMYRHTLYQPTPDGKVLESPFWIETTHHFAGGLRSWTERSQMTEMKRSTLNRMLHHLDLGHQLVGGNGAFKEGTKLSVYLRTMTRRNAHSNRIRQRTDITARHGEWEQKFTSKQTEKSVHTWRGRRTAP